MSQNNESDTTGDNATASNDEVTAHSNPGTPITVSGDGGSAAGTPITVGGDGGSREQ